jgi:hypothetical protein
MSIPNRPQLGNTQIHWVGKPILIFCAKHYLMVADVFSHLKKR